MKSFNKIAVATSILFIALLIIWPLKQGGSSVPVRSDTLLTAALLGDGSQLILPLPRTLDIDSSIVTIGEKLFNDNNLSGNGFSCATCHPINGAGMDKLKLSITTSGEADEVNTPTIFNAAFNPMLTWNGKFPDLESQLDGVINNSKHMNSSWPTIITRLRQDETYRKLFKECFNEEINKRNITVAITAFERSLITPDSDFDRFLLGDEHAISSRQKEGYQLFIDYGCVSCHQGINLGGNLLARFGIFESGYKLNSELKNFDYGRFNLTQKEKDRFVFHVPGLRNIATTAPYFHDGSAPTLAEAIKTMARIQLDVDLPEQDVSLIESFLQSLTGSYRGRKL